MERIFQHANIVAMFLIVMSCTTGPAHAGPMLNKYLPKQLKADLEIRYRLEYRDNFDFNESRHDQDVFHLQRTRLSLLYNPVKDWGVFIQGQDSRIWDAEFAGKATFENFMDIRQLYVNYENAVAFEPLQINKISARVGRQEFSFGAQRLIGGFNWSNLAQTFDGGKAGVHFVPAHLQVDIFGGDKTQIKTPREFDDLYDGSSKERIWGYYASIKVLRETLIEQYLIRRVTEKNVSFGPSGTGAIDDFTAGGRIKKAFANGIDYEVEAAKQWGEFRDKDVNGIMAVGILGYTVTQLASKPRMSFEFDYASGDSDPADGKMETFDNLYPTNHLFYGYIDFVSLQNLNNYRYQFSFKPTKKLKLQADLVLHYLATVKDSYYSVARAVVRTATSKVDNHLGNEIDLTADYKLNDWTNVGIGYSHFFAGDYLRQTGADDDADFFYLQTQFSL